MTVLPYALALRPVYYGHPIINGVPLAKVPPKVAKRRLKVLADRLQIRSIKLQYRDEQWLTRPNQLKISVGYQTSLNKAWRIGRQGSPVRRWREILFTRRVSIPLDVKANPQRVREHLFKLTPEIERAPENASFDLATGAILPEKNGRRLDLESTMPRLVKAVSSHRNRRVSLTFIPIRPRTTGEELRAIRVQYLLASYSTVFDPTLHVRAGNIARGAQQINGYLLSAGGVFSFNRTTGPRDKAHGYGEALEIINERLVPGVGGGICQVSSTLYNAVLLSGLKVLERYPHSLPLGYVPAGRDATVYYDRLDFIFKNTTKGNLLILAEVKGERITVALLAEEKPLQHIKIKTEVLERIPFTRRWEMDVKLPPGVRRVEKPGQKGIKVKTERLIYQDEEIIRRELLSIDTYKPQPEVVKIGPPKKDGEKKDDTDKR